MAGENPLVYAAQEGHELATQLLLSVGADPSALQEDHSATEADFDPLAGYTPAHAHAQAPVGVHKPATLPRAGSGCALASSVYGNPLLAGPIRTLC